MVLTTFAESHCTVLTFADWLNYIPSVSTAYDTTIKHNNYNNNILIMPKYPLIIGVRVQ